jgi:hypothetical protein
MHWYLWKSVIDRHKRCLEQGRGGSIEGSFFLVRHSIRCISVLETRRRLSGSFIVYNAAIKKVEDLYQAETRRNSIEGITPRKSVYNHVLYQIRRLTKYL